MPNLSAQKISNMVSSVINIVSNNKMLYTNRITVKKRKMVKLEEILEQENMITTDKKLVKERTSAVKAATS